MSGITSKAEELRTGGQIALAIALLALRPSATPEDRVCVISIPTPVVVTRTIVAPPAPPAVVSKAIATCPAPVHESPRAAPENFPSGMTHVVAAETDARWIAAWNRDYVWVSHDGGATWERELDRDGVVGAVTFDCFGHAIVLRDATQVGIHDGDVERWHRVPGLHGGSEDPNTLIGGGPDVVVLGITTQQNWTARIAISSDLGATWAHRDLMHWYESHNASGRQDRDGTIHLAMAFADCMSDPMDWYTIDRTGKIHVDDNTTSAVGMVYVHGDVTYAGGQFRHMHREWQAIAGLNEQVWAVKFLGVVPRAITDSVVYRLEDGVATPLRPWPVGVQPLAVDLSGRIWGLDGERLVAVDGHAAPVPAELLTALPAGD